MSDQSSPRAARDGLGRKDAFVDEHIIHREMGPLLGENLFDLMYERWLPRRGALQPIFTKHHVRDFGGATWRRRPTWSPADGPTESKSTLTPSAAD
jgi:hypothetical protein